MLADILECRTGLVGETGNRNWKKKNETFCDDYDIYIFVCLII